MCNCDKYIYHAGRECFYHPDKKCLDKKCSDFNSNNKGNNKVEHIFFFTADKDWEPDTDGCWTDCPFSYLIRYGHQCKFRLDSSKNCPFKGNIDSNTEMNGIDDCMFGDLDVDCNSDCPKKIHKLCDASFSRELECMIFDSVNLSKRKTIEEIRDYVKNWNPEKEVPHDYYTTREYVNLKRHGAEILKNDILDELNWRMEKNNVYKNNM